MTIGETLAMMEAKGVSGLPVVDNDAVVGIVTSRDIAFETEMGKPVSDIMTKKVVEKIQNRNNIRRSCKKILHKHRIEKLQ